MPDSVTAKFRRPTDPRRKAPAPSGRSIWFLVAAIASSAVIGVVVTDLVDPGKRAGAAPGGVADFTATFAVFMLLFATGFALLSTIFDLILAWARSTPESERRRDGDGGADGGFFDLLGFGDGDCGGGDGGGD